jgi:DNA-binding transcriptional ArsR family regulator
MSVEKVFEALSSTARRRILAYLSETTLTAGEIAKRFEMSQPGVSKHLSVLENAGLIWRKKEGQFVHYGLELENLQSTVAGYLREVCPPSRKLRKESQTISARKKTGSKTN